MLTSVDVEFIFDSACLSASLGDKGLFAANILQIADYFVFVFLLFLQCFSPIVRLFFPRERVKCSAILYFKTTQTTQPRPQVFNNLAILLYD